MYLLCIVAVRLRWLVSRQKRGAAKKRRDKSHLLERMQKPAYAAVWHGESIVTVERGLRAQSVVHPRFFRRIRSEV